MHIRRNIPTHTRREGDREKDGRKGVEGPGEGLPLRVQILRMGGQTVLPFIPPPPPPKPRQSNDNMYECLLPPCLYALFKTSFVSCFIVLCPEWLLPISDVHPIMMEKSALAGEGKG